MNRDCAALCHINSAPIILVSNWLVPANQLTCLVLLFHSWSSLWHTWRKFIFCHHWPHDRSSEHWGIGKSSHVWTIVDAQTIIVLLLILGVSPAIMTLSPIINILSTIVMITEVITRALASLPMCSWNVWSRCRWTETYKFPLPLLHMTSSPLIKHKDNYPWMIVFLW